MHHDFKTVYWNSVQKRAHYSDDFRIYMFSKIADLKNNNKNHMKPYDLSECASNCNKFLPSRTS